MLITYVGGPLHRRMDNREDLVTEADVSGAVVEPTYSYRSSITSQGQVVEAILVHMLASQADYENRELQLNHSINAASRFV